jgi:hypothetical protein
MVRVPVQVPVASPALEPHPSTGSGCFEELGMLGGGLGWLLRHGSGSFQGDLEIRFSR